MAKDKKNRSKQGKKPSSLLDAAATSLKKFRRVARHVTKLSTGQKVVGGLALVAAGVTYLVNKQTDADSTAATMPNAAAAEASSASSASLASEDGYEAEEPAAVMGDYRKKRHGR